MEILILQNKSIHNTKLKGDNFQIRLKIIPNPLFYRVRYQRYDNEPHYYDAVHEMIIASYEDVIMLYNTLDLTFTGKKKLKKWLTQNIPYI